MRSYRLALIGFGNVGQGFAQILRDRGPELARQFEIDLKIVAVSDLLKGSVYDPEGLLTTRLNRQLVDAAIPDDKQRADLRFLVERHRELTGSARAAAMLADWDATIRAFWRVAPIDEISRIERGNEGRLGDPR